MTKGTVGRLDNPFRSSTEIGASEPPSELDSHSRAVALDLRPMVGFDEEYVEREADGSSVVALCNEILARCQEPPGADLGLARERTRRLLVAERDAALVELRRLSLGDDVEATVCCPECQQRNEIAFSLTDLPIEIPEIDRFVDVDLGSGLMAQLRLPTSGDQEDLFSAGLETRAEQRSWLLARVLISYGDRPRPFAADFTAGLAIGVRRRLEAALEAQLPELDLSTDVTCQHCGAAFRSPYEVAGFFFPR